MGGGCPRATVSKFAEERKNENVCVWVFMQLTLSMWSTLWELNGPLNLGNEKAKVVMIWGERRWLLYECIQMCVHVVMLTTVVVCGWGCISRSWLCATLPLHRRLRSLLVSVCISRRSGVDLSSASLSRSVCWYVCEVPAPADASEIERSDLRHVPGAKVKGHHTQTNPEKLSVRERRGLWDHLTNTLTHNIIYCPHLVSLTSAFRLHTLLSFLSFVCTLLWMQYHQQNRSFIFFYTDFKP